MLKGFDESYFMNQHLDFKEIKALREEILLRIFDDDTYLLAIRYKAVAVLAGRNSPLLVLPMLKLLNSVVDSDIDSFRNYDLDRDPEHYLRSFVNYVGQIHMQESYEGLKTFLIRLLTENPKNKDLFLTWTAFSLGWVSLKLNIGDSVSVMRLAIPHLQVGQSDLQALQNFARQFDIFNAPEGIKEILTHYAADKMPELEEKCLNLLEKYDPDFVREQREEKASTNTEGEETNESEPTE